MSGWLSVTSRKVLEKRLYTNGCNLPAGIHLSQRDCPINPGPLSGLQSYLPQKVQYHAAEFRHICYHNKNLHRCTLENRFRTLKVETSPGEMLWTCTKDKHHNTILFASWHGFYPRQFESLKHNSIIGGLHFKFVQWKFFCSHWQFLIEKDYLVSIEIGKKSHFVSFEFHCFTEHLK